MKQLKVKDNKFIPFGKFYIINLFGTLFRRDKYKNTRVYPKTINHEGIHECQAEDFIPNKSNKLWKKILGYLIFYIVYLLEFLLKAIVWLFCYNFKIYHSLSFEQEAYKYQYIYDYQDNRKRWEWTKYLFKVIRNGRKR